ncbi:hypothetical protein [Cytophaga aurantiaca]|uniref:hypothetical protein n=1 Tax=Cytophaga aurantiaca TaxID=29530 RepID=UPI0003A034CC|nr:hypothetical protein [Cytophaga aurantiaca]
MNTLTKTLFWLTFFSIAMGFMETAVVVDLRELYYPEGFDFPLMPIAPRIALTEFLREAATIIMLAGIGILAGKNKMQRFAFFIYAFAIWDIFYYIFLKVLLDWPASVFTWDILFLIPVPWVGPILAPCIVSLTMIVLTAAIIYLQENGFKVTFKQKEFSLQILGCMIIIGSFIWDYVQTHDLSQMWTVSSKEALLKDMTSYIPQAYNWWIFWAGEALIVYGIVLFIIRVKKEGQTKSSLLVSINLNQ